MPGFFRKLACVLFLAVFLAGCPAAGPVGGASGGPSDLSDFKGDAPAQETAQESPDATNVAARPHPGGVTSPGVETGGDDDLIAEGTVEPVCRSSSGDVQYRIKGSVTLASKRGVCILEGDTGQYVCAIDKMVLRFWNGTSCQSKEFAVTLGKFEGSASGRDISDLSVYEKTNPDIQMISFSKMQSSTENPPIDVSNTNPIGGSIQEAAKKILAAAPQDTVAVSGEHPVCGPPQESSEPFKENHLQVLPITSDLPECTNFGRPTDDASGALKFPLTN